MVWPIPHALARRRVPDERARKPRSGRFRPSGMKHPRSQPFEAPESLPGLRFKKTRIFSDKNDLKKEYPGPHEGNEAAARRAIDWRTFSRGRTTMLAGEGFGLRRPTARASSDFWRGSRQGLPSSTACSFPQVPKNCHKRHRCDSLQLRAIWIRHNPEWPLGCNNRIVCQDRDGGV